MSVDHLFISQPYGDMLQAEFFGSAAELRGDDPASILQIANSGGERAHPGGDRGAGGRARGVSAGPGDADHSGARHGPGGPGGAHRPLAARGETPPPPAGISLLPGWLVNPDAKKWLIVGIGAILILIGINAALR